MVKLQQTTTIRNDADTNEMTNLRAASYMTAC